MDKKHPFGFFVRRFLIEYLMVDRNLSSNTQKSYRDTIRLLFLYLADRYSTDPTKVTVEQVDAALVRSFLCHLEGERGNSVSTRNQRLAALHSLFRYIARLAPELVDHAAQIQGIPIRRSAVPMMSYLEKHEMDALLSVPNRHSANGRRDYALLLFLYNSGARASEAAMVTLADLNLDTSPSVRFFGKGRKVRTCPLWPVTVRTLREQLGRRVDGPANSAVFLNVRGQQITRYGIHTLVARTAAKAAVTVPSIGSKRVSPHTIRHTTAVHLLRAGVDINTIRAWLGHVSLETTNRYAQVDLEMKARALETCAVKDSEPIPERNPVWHLDQEIMSILTSL